MGGTIVFGVDKKNIDNEAYELKILTVVDNSSDKCNPRSFKFNKIFGINSEELPLDKIVEKVNDDYINNDNNNNKNKSIGSNSFEENDVNIDKPMQNNDNDLGNSFEVEKPELNNSIENNSYENKEPAKIQNNSSFEDETKIYDNNFLVEIKGIKGAVGHVILKYKSGGSMILSAGHWIELSHLDVKLENLEKVSKNIYQDQFREEIDNIKSCQVMYEGEKKNKYSEIANRVIQSSSNNQYCKKGVFRIKNNE